MTASFHMLSISLCNKKRIISAAEFVGETNLGIWTGVVKSYIGGTIVVGQVRVAIFHDKSPTELLHLQTVQRSLWV